MRDKIMLKLPQPKRPRLMLAAFMSLEPSDMNPRIDNQLRGRTGRQGILARRNFTVLAG